MRSVALFVMFMLVAATLPPIQPASGQGDPWVGRYVEYEVNILSGFRAPGATQPQSNVLISGVLRGEIVSRTTKGYIANYTLQIERVSPPIDTLRAGSISRTLRIESPFEIMSGLEELGMGMMGDVEAYQLEVVSLKEEGRVLGVSSSMFKGREIQVLEIEDTVNATTRITTSFMGQNLTIDGTMDVEVHSWVTPLGIPLIMLWSMKLGMRTGGMVPGLLTLEYSAKLSLRDADFPLSFGKPEFRQDGDLWYFISYSPELDVRGVELDLEEARLTVTYGGYGNFSLMASSQVLNKTGGGVEDVDVYVNAEPHSTYYKGPSRIVAMGDGASFSFQVIVMDLPKPKPYLFIPMDAVLTLTLSKDARPVRPAEPTWILYSMVAVVVAVAAYILVRRRRAGVGETEGG